MAETLVIKLGTDLTIEAIKSLTQLVITRAVTETRFAWDNNNQLKKLNRKLEVIGAFLEDLDRSNSSQPSTLVHTWLKRVKEAFYMTDDVLDEFAYDNLRRKLEVNKSIFPTFVDEKLFRLRMSKKVGKMLSLFDDIDKEAKEIGLNQVELAKSAVAGGGRSEQDYGANGWNHARQFASHTNGFVGREDDEKVLVEMVCNSSESLGGGDDLRTFAIIGMGGLGKTTLARRLYDNEKICSHFADKKHWICVSENFNIPRLLNEMAESITSEKEELSNTDAIIGKLRKGMIDNKFLLVLDDVWNDNKELWDSFKGSLRRIGALSGSVILITTRSHEVGKNAGVAYPHILKGLSRDESWSLLKQNVFISGNSSSFTTRQEELGRRIVEKCKGVPLAIKVVGGLLQSRQHLHEWEAIEKSELWDLPQGQNQMVPSLMLSFNHLPSPSLKQCFAYFSIFPRGCYVYKSELIGVWSSQGYLCDHKKAISSTSVEIGEDYLKILLSSSLLLENEVEGGKFVCYSMHDLVYDLAVYVSGDDLIKETKDLQEKGNCRHLTFTSDMNKAVSECPPEKVLIKLRTIWLTGKFVPWSMLIQARYLRTLFLDDTGITELPFAIGLLKHLRYLDLSHNPIRTLPNSVGKLYQLQTIVLQDCKYMIKLPKVLNSLANLRYIWTKSRMFAWKGLAQLSNLQALPRLALEADEEGWTIDELGKLHQLRDEISILGLECVRDKTEAVKAGLALKAKVTKLTLAWSKTREGRNGVSDDDVLEGLEPHPNITSLEVRNFKAEQFPLWIRKMAVLTEQPRSMRTQLSNLTVVKLLNCSRCRILPTLGELPLLECLILSGLDVDCIHNEFYGDEHFHTPGTVSFPSLRELEISNFQKLTTWMVPPHEAFPRLENFRVSGCDLLESLPALGINSLRSLELKNLSNLVSLDIIKYCPGLKSLLVNDLPKITSLPQELANCRKLEKLCLNDICELISLPTGLESLVCFESLLLRRCPALSFIPDGFLVGLSSLREFYVYDCPILRKIPRSIEGCTSLVSLTILKCPMMEGSSIDFSKLLHLSELWICYNTEKHTKSLLNAVQHLPKLRHLGISGFRDDEEMGHYFSDIAPFNRLPSLTSLVLSGHPKIKTLPRQLGLLNRIVALFIWKFEEIERIPDWICNITSLEVLFLEFCKNLKCLPSKEVLQRLPRLRYLKIMDCPFLSERYAEVDSSEWHNISHINCIVINDIVIQGRL